jgi:hypothetical protein
MRGRLHESGSYVLVIHVHSARGAQLKKGKAAQDDVPHWMPLRKRRGHGQGQILSIDRSRSFKASQHSRYKDRDGQSMPYCKELLHLTSAFEAAESSFNQNFMSLLDFSLGRLNDLEVKDHLGIDSDEDLFLLMTQAHLPMPRLSSETTQDMVASLNALSA